jgi:uncharacterized protein (TIGR03086 family)
MAMTTFPAPVADGVNRVVAGAAGCDLGFPTPCPDFDLKTLVNHLIGTTAALARVGRREPLDATDPYGARRDATGGNWQQVLSSNIDELARTWGDPGAWQGSVEMSGLAMAAPMIGEMAVAEVALHGWDLATATGQQLVLDEEVALELLRSIEETGELGRRMGAYGPEVVPDADATAFERALAAAGRNPRQGVVDQFRQDV